MECVLLAIMTNYPQAAERLQPFSYMPQAIIFEFKFSRAKRATVTYFKTVQSGWAICFCKLRAQRPKIWETYPCSEKPLSGLVTTAFRILPLWCGHWAWRCHVPCLGLHGPNMREEADPDLQAHSQSRSSELQKRTLFPFGAWQCLCPLLHLLQCPSLPLFSPAQHLVEMLSRHPDRGRNSFSLLDGQDNWWIIYRVQ